MAGSTGQDVPSRLFHADKANTDPDIHHFRSLRKSHPTSEILPFTSHHPTLCLPVIRHAEVIERLGEASNEVALE